MSPEFDAVVYDLGEGLLMRVAPEGISVGRQLKRDVSDEPDSGIGATASKPKSKSRPKPNTPAPLNAAVRAELDRALTRLALTLKEPMAEAALAAKTHGLNKPTPERINAAVEVELNLVLQRLRAYRDALYRTYGEFPDGLGAAIYRLEFVLHGLMTGLVTPVETVSSRPGT